MSQVSGPIQVLHVEDDPAFAEMSQELLEREDDRLEVATAPDAEAGLERLATDDVDCVVSDYDMPGKTGIEFLRAVRDDYPDLPFVLFTGKGNEEVASEAIAAGVTDYLQKQTGTEQYELLANRIRHAVAQYRAARRAADLERIRALVADVNQALVRATDRETVETEVCETVAAAEPYSFAWIGAPDEETGTVEVRASAGVEAGYLDAVEITVDDAPTGQGPVGQALRTGEIATVQDTRVAENFEPWREEALDRDYRSSAAIPLSYEDTVYGVLAVYADRSNAFDDQERALLVELADDVAQALHHQDLQRTLRLQRDRFQHLVDGIDQYAIFMLDPDGDVATWNSGAERIKGYAEDEAVGAHYATFFPDDAVEAGEPDDLLARAEATGSVSGTGWRVRADGSRFRADFTLVALTDGAGDLRGFAKVTRDLTDEDRREQELERQNERLERFASVVSHDLRNPLSVAAGRIELARDDCESAHLEEAVAAIERCQSRIDDVLTLARDGETLGALEPVPLSEACSGCWDSVATAEATLVCETDLTIRADRSRFQQLLENLFRNAVEHGGDDVVVTVGDHEDGFYVADDGPGIPEADREAAFEAGHSTSTSGEGLGLDIVRQVARAHDWGVALAESADGGLRVEVTGVPTA